jgi:hypothetical protein
MKHSTFHVEMIRARDLDSFMCDYVRDGEVQQISPISRYRAIAQSNNPHADPDDIGLLLGYFGETCVGYQGVLPGLLRTKRGLGKVYWCTAAYVLPEFRKRMVTIHLLKKLMSLGKDIVSTGFNKVGGDVLRGLHFQELPPLEYLTLRLDRLDFLGHPFQRFYRLQKRWLALERISQAALRRTRRYFYPSARRTYYRIVADRADTFLRGAHWREDTCVDQNTVESDRKCDSQACFERGPEVINWMLRYPWIRDRVATFPPYYFTEAYEQFRYTVLTLEEAGTKRPGFVVLSSSLEKGISKLKVLDLYCREEEEQTISWLILRQAAQLQADEIELPLRLKSSLKSVPLAAFLAKREQRR